MEDNDGDIRLLEEAFKETDLRVNLHVVRDGEQALKFLHREPPHEKAPRPAFVLLDLNLPLKRGDQVLAEIKQDASLRQIPVFILSTSTRIDDISQAYDLHANCYIPKPAELEELMQMGRQIESFWLSTAVLPA